MTCNENVRILEEETEGSARLHGPRVPYKVRARPLGVILRGIFFGPYEPICNSPNKKHQTIAFDIAILILVHGHWVELG